MNNDVKNHIKENKSLYLTITGVVLIFLIGIIGYSAGYRFKDNFMVGKVGSVSLSLPLAQTSVYVNEDDAIVTENAGQTVKIPLSPKEHSIIVAREGYYPWTKTFRIESGQNLELHPIFVLTNTSGEIITSNDPEYATIRRNIIGYALPTSESPLTSSDGSVSIYMNDNAIIASTTEWKKPIIQPDTVIESVSFYKDRSDAVIFATQNGVYVLETDTIGKQNFMPIYKGQSPAFIPASDNSLYILDGNQLMEVII